MVQRLTPSCSHSSTWGRTLIQHHDNSGQTHISKQHIRWHTNHSVHVTRWRHTHRNTNRNWPAQHMSACRYAFRLRSVQYSGHILVVTYSFWFPERSTFLFVFLSCLWVWHFTPLVQTHSTLSFRVENQIHTRGKQAEIFSLPPYLSTAPTFFLFIHRSSCLLPYQSSAQNMQLGSHVHVKLYKSSSFTTKGVTFHSSL